MQNKRGWLLWRNEVRCGFDPDGGDIVASDSKEEAQKLAEQHGETVVEFVPASEVERARLQSYFKAVIKARAAISARNERLEAEWGELKRAFDFVSQRNGVLSAELIEARAQLRLLKRAAT